MNANDLLQKYCIDETHLPNPTGMNVVEIKAIDTEEYTAFEQGRKVSKRRHLLWLAGFDLPFRLNNTRLKLLIALLGQETNGWIGKKIGIYVSAQMSYGEVVTSLMIHIQPIDQSIPPVSQRRFSQLPPGAPGGWPPQSPPPGALATQVNSPDSDMTPIGTDAAAEVCCQLEERGKTWDDLRIFLNANGLGEMIAGKHPGDCPKAIRSTLRSFLASSPKVKPRPDPEKFKKLWLPPPAEVIDKRTGEVINPAAGLPGQPPNEVPDDDIPF